MHVRFRKICRKKNQLKKINLNTSRKHRKLFTWIRNYFFDISLQKYKIVQFMNWTSFIRVLSWWNVHIFARSVKFATYLHISWIEQKIAHFQCTGLFHIWGEGGVTYTQDYNYLSNCMYIISKPDWIWFEVIIYPLEKSNNCLANLVIIQNLRT